MPRTFCWYSLKVKTTSGPTNKKRLKINSPRIVFSTLLTEDRCCRKRLATEPATITPTVKATGIKATTAAFKNRRPEARSGWAAIKRSFILATQIRNRDQSRTRQSQPKKRISINGVLTKAYHQPAHESEKCSAPTEYQGGRPIEGK